MLGQEIKMTNESLKSLQAQLEMAYLSSASSSPGNLAPGLALLSSSVAVPAHNNNVTSAVLVESREARIKSLEKEVQLLDAELKKYKGAGAKIKDQLSFATVVPPIGSLPVHQLGPGTD